MKPNILFVDDDAALCGLLSLYFRHHGLEVTLAATVRQATDLIAEKRFQALILDLCLGEVDGLEVLRYVRDKNAELSVIIFTGLELDEQLVKKALASRVDGFVRKTDALPTLLNEVRRHLPKIPELTTVEAAAPNMR